jgi:hypothetical protein
VSDESPLCGAEERVAFHIGGACSCSKSAVFVFNQKFPDERFAQTVSCKQDDIEKDAGCTDLDIWGDPECSGNGTSSLRMFANVALRFFPLKGVVPKSIS